MAIPIKQNCTILTDVNGAQLIVPEQSSGPVIEMTLLNETGIPVALADIDTATLTIYARDEASQPLVNAVDHVDIKNTGRGAIHATSGLLTLTPMSLDNSISGSAGELEWHRLLIEVGYAGTKKLKYEIDYQVQNLYRVG